MKKTTTTKKVRVAPTDTGLSLKDSEEVKPGDLIQRRISTTSTAEDICLVTKVITKPDNKKQITFLLYNKKKKVEGLEVHTPPVVFSDFFVVINSA